MVYTIYARYLDENGYDGDRIYAREKGLIKGELYRVDCIDMGRWHTNIDLAGISGDFNSVMFEFIHSDRVIDLDEAHDIFFDVD